MVTFSKDAGTIWRDYSTDGVPSSGKKDPDKIDIRAWGTTIEGVLEDMADVKFSGQQTIVIGGLVSQSNLYANDTATGGSYTSSNVKVRAWANSGGAFVTATLGSDPFRPNSGSGVPNNALFQFGKWVQEQTGADIKLFLHAIPDTPATDWLTVPNGGPNTSSNRYDSTTSTAGGTVLKTQTLVPAMFASAEMVATGKTKFDIVIILRGENDQNDGVDQNETEFLKLIDQVRAESWADDDTIFLICELNQEEQKYPGAQEAWRRIVRNSARPNLALSQSYGLASVGDGTHFTGSALETIGRERLPAALKSLVAPKQPWGVNDGRNNLINISAASNTVVVKASNTVIQNLYTSGDAALTVDPQYLGQGDSFTVLNFSAVYSVVFSPGAGSLFSPDTWNKNATTFTIGPGEAYEFIKVGPSSTAAYMVVSSFRDFPFKYSTLNGTWNGSFEMGNKAWSLGTNWTIERDSTNAYSGNWVAKNSDTSGTARDLESLSIQRCEPDDFVLFEYQNKTDSVMNITSLRARAAWLDKSQNELSDSGGSNNTTASISWRRIFVWAKAPASTVFAKARARIQKGTPASGNGYAWLDNAFMRVFRKLDWFQDEWLIQAADRAALTSNTSLQNIFTTATNGAITLEVGTYYLDLYFRMTGLSSSSGDIQFGNNGTATATLELIAHAKKGGGVGTGQMCEITASTATSITSANTSTAAQAVVRGIITVTVAGTFIPAVAQGVASTAVVKAGAYCRVRRLPTDSAGVLAMGAWS